MVRGKVYKKYCRRDFNLPNNVKLKGYSHNFVGGYNRIHGGGSEKRRIKRLDFVEERRRKWLSKSKFI